ncbi:unnamed protein product [Porites evermanni]|uniref:Uncharacterized protein n=1 Tax=Porites evermanni TaxID=104178 RepID=A0ABN8RDX4_9CNID|nr:unnamed protein product [Porites evermanni]
MYMSGVDPSTRGLPAVEIQRYASNCNYTVNLLHSRFFIDNFNILEGPSNGFEMIHFFEESLQAVDHVGNPVLANGDVIFCFRSIKAYLRQHEQFSINFTELAIIQGLQTITPAISQNIFSHCGFVILKLLSVQSLVNSTQWRVIML